MEHRYNFVLLTPIHRNEYAVIDLWTGEYVRRSLTRDAAIKAANKLNHPNSPPEA